MEKKCFGFTTCGTMIDTGERVVRAPLLCAVCRKDPSKVRLARIATEAITGIPMPVSAPRRFDAAADKAEREKWEKGGAAWELVALICVCTIFTVLCIVGLVAITIWAIS